MKLFFGLWKFSKITGKKQKSKDKNSSFDDLIQENIDLSDIYQAVISVLK